MTPHPAHAHAASTLREFVNSGELAGIVVFTMTADGEVAGSIEVDDTLGAAGALELILGGAQRFAESEGITLAVIDAPAAGGQG